MLKLLIVEDEAGICSSIVSSVYWEDLGCEVCGTASSGIEALELCLQNPPDIVLSDIVMPGIDGLTLLRYIKQKNPATRFIILTGYRNFDYAKDALNLGAAFFMLKPIRYDELEAAVKKLVGEIQAERSGRERDFQVEKVLRDMLLGRLYGGEGMDKAVNRTLRRLSSFFVALMEFDDSSRADAMHLQSLHAFCAGIIDGEWVKAVKMDVPRLAFLFPCDNAGEARQYFQQLAGRINGSFPLTVSVGLSSQLEGSGKLSQGYLEAVRAVSRKFFSGDGSVIAYSGEEKADQPDYNALSLRSQDVADLIRRAGGVTLSREAGKLFDRIIENLGGNIDLIKSTVIAALTLCCKTVLHKDSRQMAVLFEKYANFQKVIGCGSLETLKDIFVNVVLDLGDYETIKKSSNKQQVIGRILDYIQQNYASSISLNDVAKVVYLSPSYLSAFITNETGKTFVELLNEMRINRAIELLRDKNQKIFSVAHQVGFNEPQYFSLAFKRYTGLSPSDYRRHYFPD